ncbi:MAG: hypothetical protein WA981_06695 [Glaciecola sp.]
MKQSLILQQHIPFASMIYKALDFCEVMLSHSDTLYPFAVLSIGNDMQCVFTPTSQQHAPESMIEALQLRINERKLFAKSTVSLLVYPAIISHPEQYDSDALVFTITDSAGKNNVTIYPYCMNKHGITVNKPYTCDFSD